MKRLFIMILVPLLAVTLAASAKITFEKTELDFGELESGKIVDMEYKFKNTGDETLIIKKRSSQNRRKRTVGPLLVILTVNLNPVLGKV